MVCFPYGLFQDRPMFGSFFPTLLSRDFGCGKGSATGLVIVGGASTVGGISTGATAGATGAGVDSTREIGTGVTSPNVG